MSITPSQDDINEIKEIWQWIFGWKDELGLTLEELADRVGFSPDHIERAMKGEPIPIRHALGRFVAAFRLEDYKLAPWGGDQSYDELKQLLRREKSPQHKLLDDWGC